MTNQKISRKYLPLILAIFLALGLTLGVIRFASADNTLAPETGPITVNTNADNATAGDSACTLREAISNANGDTDTSGGDCAAGSGTDTIDFAGSYTITLSSALPDIATAMIIDGAGQSIAVSGANTYQVFDVTASGNLTVTSLTITKGFASRGGGIYNNGTLAIANSTFSGNSATFDGGGIYNNNGLITSIANSTFSGNSAYLGGGILNLATITSIANSTFSGNSATNAGGIYNNGTLSTIANSTFSGNSASSGLSGSGIWNDYILTTIANTIIANSPSGGNCDGVPAGTNNLSDDGTCGFAAGGGSDNDANIKLAPLADNDGSTETHALLPGSTAIDSGDGSTCSSSPVNGVDQRGVTRPQGVACDVGAFEHQISTGTLIVNTTADSDDGVCSSSHCTLREAISSAGSGANIDFSVSGTITLSSALPDIATAMTIGGAGQSIAVSGANTYRVFTVAASGNLTVTKMTIANGYADSGGGINNLGALTISNSTFSGNSASLGGGIYNNGTLTVSNSTFSGNSATQGGGIYNANGATITSIANSTFSGNSANVIGGSIYNYPIATITNIANTIIANSPSGGNCNGVPAGTNNLSDDGTCGFAAGGGGDNDANIKLAPLADNGGPTETHALLPGSTAIDSGDGSTCSSAPVNGADQTMFPRPVGAECDIGAFEARMQIFIPLIIR